MDHDADTPITAEAVAWADVIFVMERAYRNKLQKRFRRHLRGRVICLDIPDKYAFMNLALVSALRRTVSRHPA